jgi:hypothetical protein
MASNTDTKIGKWTVAAFFAMLFTYQTYFIFQGVDLSDEGFLATFYQNIFTHPESVQYNFMFWFTGVIGGLYYKLFHSFGLIGLRMGGVMVVTTTAYATYRILKGRIGTPTLLTGIFLVVVNLNNDIKIINYNTLSAMFFVIVILLMTLNLEKPKAWYLVLAGSILAMNIFVRFPNVLGLSLCAMPVLAPGPVRQKTRAVLYMIAGLLLGLAAMLLTLRYTGQTDVFLNAFQLVREMSQAKPQPGIVGGNYGMLKILTQFRSDILHSLLYTLLILAFLAGTQILMNATARSPRIVRMMTMAVTILIPVVTALLILKGGLRYYSSLNLYHGAGLLAVMLVLHRRMPLDIQYIAFAGLLFQLFYPVGSAQGILTAGKFCLWITTPIALDMLSSGIKLNIPTGLRRTVDKYTGSVPFSDWSRLALRNGVIAAVLVFGLYFTFRYPFFDYGNRLSMKYEVDNRNMRLIGTTKDRSDALNALLKASEGLLAPGDTVLAYDCLPMYHFMTGTTPYLHNSYPWLYSPDAFAKDLGISNKANHTPPVVVRQKIQTIGDGSRWPEKLVTMEYSAWQVNAGRNRALDSYLEEKGYRVYWESPYFQILTPAGYHPTDTARK